jgi:hypothetical protein
LFLVIFLSFIVTVVSNAETAQSTPTLADVVNFVLNGPEVRLLTEAEYAVVQQAVADWEAESFDTIERELRNVDGYQEERVSFCARVLYCLRNAHNTCDYVVKIQDYLNYNEVIAYLTGGENSDVLCNDAGKPCLWMVVADKDIEEKARTGMNSALQWYKENRMPDMLTCAGVNGNGASIFFVANTHADRGTESVWLDEWGEICLNQGVKNSTKLSNIAWRNQYILALWVEPYGIRYYQLSNALGLFQNESEGPWRNGGYCEVVKSLMAGYVAEALLELDEDNIAYSVCASSFPVIADDFARSYAKFGVTTDGSQTKRLLALMADFAYIPGFESLKNVSTYNQVISEWDNGN